MSVMLFVCTDSSNYSDFIHAIETDDQILVNKNALPAAALKKIQDGDIDLVVVGEQLKGLSGLQFIEQVTRINPFLSCALMSSLTAEDFHEASEGMGVLMQLPLDLTKADAEALKERYFKVTRLLAGVTPEEIKQ